MKEKLSNVVLGCFNERETDSCIALCRFGHEYLVRQGETMEEIAARFGTTVEMLMMLNKNTITNVHNPARLKAGDTVCVVPQWHKASVSLLLVLLVPCIVRVRVFNLRNAEEA